MILLKFSKGSTALLGGILRQWPDGPTAPALTSLYAFSRKISYRQLTVAVFLNIAATEQYFSSLSSMACFTAPSSNSPRSRYTISSLVHTAGGCAARSPEQITCSDSSFCLFFFSTETTSVAVQAPSAISTNSIGPGALLDSRSESVAMACPEGLVAKNVCSPIHCTEHVCIPSPLLWPNRIANNSPFIGHHTNGDVLRYPLPARYPNS